MCLKFLINEERGGFDEKNNKLLQFSILKRAEDNFWIFNYFIFVVYLITFYGNMFKNYLALGLRYKILSLTYSKFIFFI